MINSLIDENNETIDDLLCGYKVIQPISGFRFSIDAVLLSHFANVKKGDTCVDFCSGCGVVAFLLLAHNDIKKVSCVEIQPYFAELIQRNINMNETQRKMDVVCDDLKNSAEIFGYESVDVVTCNPPYLKDNTGKVSESELLNIARREVKTNLEDIIKSTSAVLKNKGRFAMVHIPERIDEIFSLMAKYNLPVKRARLIQPDVNSQPNLILVEGVKNANSTVSFEKTLMIYEDGEYSKEIGEIYGHK